MTVTEAKRLKNKKKKKKFSKREMRPEIACPAELYDLHRTDRHSIEVKIHNIPKIRRKLCLFFFKLHKNSDLINLIHVIFVVEHMH